MKIFKHFLATIEKILPQLKNLAAMGATSYLVGGSTRDLLMDQEIYDLDIEVHGISFTELEKALANFSQTCSTGKMFMVIKTPKFEADWAIPRTDGCGRRPEVKHDKNLDVKAAARRRDLTINAIYLDLNKLASNWQTISIACDAGLLPAEVLTFHDPYNGMIDLQNKILRAIDANFFIQDPLRFFRVMMFAARFNMTACEELNQICRAMPIVLDNPKSEHYVSAERINQELYKMLLKSKQPSIGFYWLKSTGRLQEFFPELAPAVGMQKTFLPIEKDLFDHFCEALDATAYAPILSTTEPKFISEHEKLIIMLAALLHNTGQTLSQDKNFDPQLTAKSAEFAQNFLLRFKFSNQIIAQVAKLILWHAHPEKILLNTQASAYKILAHALAPEVSLRQLALLALFVKQGALREFNPQYWREKYQLFLTQANLAGVLEQPERAVLSGADLINQMPPGPAMGQALKTAYFLQISEGITDKKLLLEKIGLFSP